MGTVSIAALMTVFSILEYWNIFKSTSFEERLQKLLIFIPTRYNLCVIKTVDLTYKINNTLRSFHIDMGKAKLTKQFTKITKNKKKITKESPSTWVSWKTARNCFSNQFNSKESSIKKGSFFKHFSRHAQNKISRIIKKLCKYDANIKLYFAPHQISSIFTTVDKILSFWKSTIVKFFCVCIQ